ncbi:hypothetical protein WJX75_008671 [Coccomyxa subellipsoidea]|uniref:Uncharacterized protein n=1 Tax=Coccomyxa subellipsoidea TaxID=248742 RepID=A0ABR2YH88_9CHLO
MAGCGEGRFPPVHLSGEAVADFWPPSGLAWAVPPNAPPYGRLTPLPALRSCSVSVNPRSHGGFAGLFVGRTAYLCVPVTPVFPGGGGISRAPSSQVKAG